MPRKRGKDSNRHKTTGGTPPKDSPAQRIKERREPRSESQKRRHRDPDAIDRPR
jgi:hypothetical protein